ncbi:choice-of-anchor D domain-containing protein [bacterium]|nr:choice-of-anchor D domain-containing protein [bacterium]
MRRETKSKGVIFIVLFVLLKVCPGQCQDLIVEGSDHPAGANGLYHPAGQVYGYNYWEHDLGGYYLYNDSFGNVRYWFVDNNTSDIFFHFWYESEAAIPPTSGYNGAFSDLADGVGTILITFLPEIEVKGNGVIIAHTDTEPDISDDTDFGTAAVNGGSVIRTYTLHNLGYAALHLTGTPRVNVTGDHAGDFPVTTQPPSEVAAEGSSTFVITFDPSSPGVRTATVSIINDDSDESPFTFAIQGTGTVPEMDVEGKGQAIVCGDDTPSTTDDTDFGAVDISDGTVVKTFTVSNTGDADLQLTGTPRVAITGDGAADFTVEIQPDEWITVSSSITFYVEFDPSVTGTRTATLSIDNTDSDENPYTFVIEGEGEDNSLPVELHSLAAVLSGKGVEISWVTESETANLGFILERRPEGLCQWSRVASYETHSELTGRGNTSQRTDYAFTDESVQPGQSCAYRLSDVNTAGEVHVCDEIHITLPGAPAVTAIEPPYPNPFNPETKINYQLAEAGPVEINVYDMLGRKVLTLVNEDQSAGSYNVYWHGDDASGSKVATGTYLVVLKTQQGVRTQKVVMLR